MGQGDDKSISTDSATEMAVRVDLGGVDVGDGIPLIYSLLAFVAGGLYMYRKYIHQSPKVRMLLTQEAVLAGNLTRPLCTIMPPWE